MATSDTPYPAVKIALAVLLTEGEPSVERLADAVFAAIYDSGYQVVPR